MQPFHDMIKILFVFGIVLGAGGHFYLGFTFVPIVVQLVTTAQHKCSDAKKLYIKQKAGRSHPAVGEIFVFVALNFLGHVSDFTGAKVRVGDKMQLLFNALFVKKNAGPV